MRFHKLEEFLQTSAGKLMSFDVGSPDYTQFIRAAQKFYIGDVRSIEGIGFQKKFPRLPYPVCAFEFEDMDAMGTLRTGFVLCQELGDKDLGTLGVISYFFVPQPVKGGESYYFNTGRISLNPNTGALEEWVNPRLTKFLTYDFPSSDDVAITDQKQSMLKSLDFVARFLAVLNCSNVEVSEIEGPEKLNKKRRKKGNVPIYSYKTLVLKTRNQRLAAGNGTHDSPRVHLRRGHIKRRKTGDFWWQPCVVGDRKKGVVMKEYNAAGLID